MSYNYCMAYVHMLELQFVFTVDLIIIDLKYCIIIPSTCIRGRDIVIALLVRVSVCLSVRLCVST